MFNSIKYSIFRAVRDKEYMFSSLVIALLMGTIAFTMTGSMLEELEEGTLEIPVAVVEVEGSEQSAFIQILEATSMFELKFVDMETATYKLEINEVDGIFEVGYMPRLLVTRSHFRQRLLQTVADSYLINSNVLEAVASENPEYLEAAIMNIIEPNAVTSEMAIADEMVDWVQSLMILMITMTAFGGTFLGFERGIMVNNDGAIASRRITASFGKVKILIADLMGAAFVGVALSFAVWAYYVLVLGVDLEMNVGLAAVAFFLTALLGVIFGAFFALIAPGKRKTREQILNGAYMGLAMTGGFATGMRGIPLLDLINQVNPMVLLSDSLMALNMGNYTRYFGFMITLIIAAVVFLVLTLITLRRNRHVDAK